MEHNHDEHPDEQCCAQCTAKLTAPIEDMGNGHNKTIVRIAITVALFGFLLVFPMAEPFNLGLFLVTYVIIGGDVLLRAIRNISKGEVFDENFLMSIATIGAFLLGEYPEAIAVMLFYQVGELFQSIAVGKSRRSIAALMDIRPDSATVERNGILIDVPPADVAVGDIIVIKAGERVPLDGIVVQGDSTLDTAALTGESLPRDITIGDDVISGCINLIGVLRVKVTRPFGQSTVQRILELVESASDKKGNIEHFITKFSRIYTPCVVFAALALAILPSLITGDWATWTHRALVFLVVSCPCALVISIPLSFFGGIGYASRQGILIKGSNFLEALASVETIVFDKTGTLTEGKFTVTEVHPNDITRDELLEITALAEGWSNHPISRSIREACTSTLDPKRVTDSEELIGRGVRATVDGRIVLAGNRRLMEEEKISIPNNVTTTGTALYVAVNGGYVGLILIADAPKKEAKEALRQLKSMGVSQTVMLTGDTDSVAKTVAQTLGVDQYRAKLLPQDKVGEVEKLLATKSPKKTLVFVGDGINDAPVLTRADVGIAMGAMGSDAAVEAADVVLMDDNLSRLPTAIAISRRTLRIVHQNIALSLGVKFLIMALSTVGLAGMWGAVFADVGVSILAILNAMRLLKGK